MLYEQAVARRPGLLVDIEKPEPMLNYNILPNHIDAIFDQDIDAMPALSHLGYGLLRKIGVPDFPRIFSTTSLATTYPKR